VKQCSKLRYVVVFISSVFFMIYGQNVSASFLCLSCPALVLVLIKCMMLVVGFVVNAVV